MKLVLCAHVSRLISRDDFLIESAREGNSHHSHHHHQILSTVGKEKGAQRMVTRLKAMISWVRKSPYFLAMLQMPIKG